MQMETVKYAKSEKTLVPKKAEYDYKQHNKLLPSSSIPGKRLWFRLTIGLPGLLEDGGAVRMRNHDGKGETEIIVGQ